MGLVLLMLRKLRLKRDERLIVVDLFCLEDLQPAPRRRLRPLDYERKINLFSCARMSGGYDEVDGASHESRVTGAHQLFRGLALARALDDRLTTSGKRSSRPARAGLIYFGHTQQITQILCITQSKSDDMMRASRRNPIC